MSETFDKPPDLKKNDNFIRIFGILTLLKFLTFLTHLLTFLEPFQFSDIFLFTKSKTKSIQYIDYTRFFHFLSTKMSEN